MGLLDFVKNRQSLFTFQNHYGENKTMRARAIHQTIMQNSRESDYNWIAPAKELVKLCNNPNFPREYAVDIEMAILNCFANIEARVSRGGDKYITKADDALAVQFCYDELGRLMKASDNEEFKKTLNSVRTRYLKEMISSAVNISTRGLYFHCKAFRNLQEEIVSRNFFKYSTMKEDFNLLDMYEQISDETRTIFKEAYKRGMFKAEESEAMFSIVKALERCGESEDLDVRAMFAERKVIFRGDHRRNADQEKPQFDSDEDGLTNN